MTTKLGLCESPNFYLPPVTHKELNPPFIRSILYSLNDLNELKATGLPFIVTLNNQCDEVKGDWSGWNDTIVALCQNAGSQLLVIDCGNELDLFWDKNNNDVPPEFAASLAIRAAQIAHKYNIKIATTSVVSSHWYDYLRQLYLLCRNNVDYYTCHFYGKQPDNWKPEQNWMFGKLSDAITQAKQLVNNSPLIFTEEGVKIGDAGGEQEVAKFMRAAYDTFNNNNIDYVSWFCSTDLVGAPFERGLEAFGLISDTGVKRPAYYQYQNINKSNVPIPVNDPYSVWKGKIGDGLLDMMRADNTVPAMASEWRPFDRPSGSAATIEQAIGMNGTVYMWHIPTRTSWRHKAS